MTSLRSSRLRSPVPARHLLLIVAGFIIWAIAFLVVYGANAVGCAFDWDEGRQRLVVTTLSGLHLALLAGLCLWTLRHRSRWRSATRPAALLACLGVALTTVALVATLFTLLPGLFLTMCQP